ncbi:MAG TPA: hypothetical protein PLZ36_17860 [Armatimonadota bacterium]|nr:hypothetical protein [Armatimonadota bacterium]HOS43105.1 hypothetical protein [Armatimonadota bacterium]
MPEEPTYATIPPTPIIESPKPQRPALVTISAVLLFCFAAVEAVQIAIRIFTFTIISRIVADMLEQPFGIVIGSDLASLQWIPRIEALLAILHLAFTIFFIVCGIGLLRMKAGIRKRIFSGLIIRFLVVNGALFSSQWLWWRVAHSTGDLWIPATLTTLNVLFYAFVVSLLTRPAVREALAHEPVTPSASEIRSSAPSL